MSTPPRSSSPETAELAIIGAGAAGMMAAIAAAEAGLHPILIDRKHKPGRKLLMCGNARCNLTNNLPPDAFLAELGDPVASFAAPAIRHFPPEALRDWFRTHGLNTIEKRGNRVFPASERASDVVNRLQDLLRDRGVPLLLNSPVSKLEQSRDAFKLSMPGYAIHAQHVLVCTGGVSYPKTGSVGDGQTFASALGHQVTPYRPGLVGLTIDLSWLGDCQNTKFEDVTATAYLKNGDTIEVAGDLEFQRWGFCGGLISNATRMASRSQSTVTQLVINLLAPLPAAKQRQLLEQAQTPQQALKRAFRDVPPRFWHALLPPDTPRQQALQCLTSWEVPVAGTRPLKEAMVTVGGISLDEVDAKTMRSKHLPNLLFAGEVLDIDGPTGGFNLQLAFATAQLAIHSLAPHLPARAQRHSQRLDPNQRQKRRAPQQQHQQRYGKRRTRR